jgi:DNA polymerase III alpha subunit
LDWETLAAHSAGVFAISGGRAGWIERRLRAGDRHGAWEAAERFAGIYDSRARLALEMHEPGDLRVAEAISEIGRRFGIECVASQPVYCLSPDDAKTLRLLAAIRANTTLDELPAEAIPHRHLHWLSPDEMRERFSRFPLALDASGELARACRPGLPDDSPIWPELGLAAGVTPDDALRLLAQHGLAERFGSQPGPIVAERLERELASITALGNAPLFLVVSDIVGYSRGRGIPVSTRGSVANSLVAYSTGITTVDPVEHDLLFERFINPARSDLPDIDLDFCSRRRDEVLDYVRNRYGSERMAIIGTISTMQLQSAVREVGKAYGLPEGEIARLAALVPRQWHPDPDAVTAAP